MKDFRSKVDAQGFYIAGGGVRTVELTALDQKKLIAFQSEFVSVDGVFQLALGNPGNLQFIVPVKWYVVRGGMDEILCIHGNGKFFREEHAFFTEFFVRRNDKFDSGLVAFRK